MRRKALNKKPKSIFSTILIVVLVVFMAIMLWSMLGSTVTEVDGIVEFYDMVEQGKFSNIYLD